VKIDLCESDCREILRDQRFEKGLGGRWSEGNKIMKNANWGVISNVKKMSSLKGNKEDPH